jgi:hypothetical protein
MDDSKLIERILGISIAIIAMMFVLLYMKICNGVLDFKIF